MSVFCPDCEARQANLGDPSYARWIGADGNFCSMHFIQRYGHGARLVPIEDYEPPPEIKAPAAKKPRPLRKDEVEA